ncbi:hypothetical protein C8R44DRAFT_736367 [Mycena epipterygia]|nr:hypothetical protein C8R44DRAFT_736367 [Mycena epipterygia]
MPVTRTPTPRRRKVTPEEAADLPKRVTRQTAAAAAVLATTPPASSVPSPIPVPDNVVPTTIGRSPNFASLPTVRETPTTQPSSASHQPDTEIPSRGSSADPPRSYLRGPAGDSNPGRTERRHTPPAHNTQFDNTALAGPSTSSESEAESQEYLTAMQRCLSTQLPPGSAAAAQILNISKPAHWTGMVEGGSYMIRPRK